MEHVVVAEHAGGVTEVRFARPPVNALNLPVVRELEATLEEVRAAPGTRALVLTGQGRCFTAGVDVKEVPRYSADEQRAMVRAINRAIHALFALPIPAVAAINGPALGGGLCVALGCDYRVATREPYCRLGLPEVEVDIPYPAGPLRVVREVLPPHTARLLVMTSHVCLPDEARALGVVDEIVPPEQVLPRALEVATRLAGLAGYVRVKAQFRAACVAELGEIVAHDRDPMLAEWITS
jgi:enoyl-CoA hydratase/carnithine racemase